MKKTKPMLPLCGASLPTIPVRCSDNLINNLKSLRLKPIIMSSDMIVTIRSGRKTVTRRLVKNKWALEFLEAGMLPSYITDPGNTELHEWGGPGDILWVRESGWVDNNFIRGFNEPTLFWKADLPEYNDITKFLIKNHCYSFPAIHMYKEFTRYFLRIKNITVERLQDITEASAIAEGIEPVQGFDSGEGVPMQQMYRNYLDYGYTEVLPIDSFISLWTKLNQNRAPWELNPWVWVIEFEPCFVKFTPDLKTVLCARPATKK